MGESQKNASAGLSTYSRGEVVKEYSQANYLSRAEVYYFDLYLRPGMKILDLGVGGGVQVLPWQRMQPSMLVSIIRLQWSRHAKKSFHSGDMW
jgi:hypothetical protein